MGLGFRNDASISTIGSKRSNGPQHFPLEKPLINDSHVMPPRVVSRRLGSRHTSRNGTAARSGETNRHLSLKTHRTYLPSSLGGKCTGMGETDAWTPWPRPTWLPETGLPGRDQGTWASPESLGRDLRVSAEATETWKTWPKPGKISPNEKNRHGRPTHTTVNAQTKVSEANPLLRIR